VTFSYTSALLRDYRSGRQFPKWYEAYRPSSTDDSLNKVFPNQEQLLCNPSRPDLFPRPEPGQWVHIARLEPVDFVYGDSGRKEMFRKETLRGELRNQITGYGRLLDLGHCQSLRGN
jgi:hypothetical protein